MNEEALIGWWRIDPLTFALGISVFLCYLGVVFYFHWKQGHYDGSPQDKKEHDDNAYKKAMKAEKIPPELAKQLREK